MKIQAYQKRVTENISYSPDHLCLIEKSGGTDDN